MSLVVASVTESTELVGWFDAQAASHVASKTKVIVFFKKISQVLKNSESVCEAWKAFKRIYDQ